MRKPKFISVAALFALAGCSAGGGNGGLGVGEGGSSGGGGTGGSSGTAGIITQGGTSSGGLPITNCENNVGTSVSGFVYDPAGRVPLYNVVVYVPVAGTEPPPFAEGASCEKCAGREARAVAVALTDATGHFVLENVPDGTNVPLVMEVGKWRRQVTIPTVAACRENVLDDPEFTRLPRNHVEGHLPKIAMVTGHSDALECLLRKIGIDDTEFTTDSGDGRVNMFYGCPTQAGVFGANKFSPALGGANFPRALTTLYSDPAKLSSYDMLILSCEGHSCDAEKGGVYQQNLKAYSDAGGRIFFDHMHYRWFNTDDAWQTVASFSGSDDFPSPFTFRVDDTFFKGGALADWLVSVDASSTRGELTILAAQNSAQEANAPLAQRWVYSESPANVQYMTMNTPIEAETEDALCGRLVHTDLHVSAGAGTDSSDQNTPFPGSCTSGPLTAQEKALEFILFDLGSCVQKEDQPPVPPVVVR